MNKNQAAKITNDLYGKKATFTQQDPELVQMWRRVQKFRIRKEKEIKAGYYINVRDTQALRNVYAVNMFLTGKVTSEDWILSASSRKAHRKFTGYDRDTTEYVSTLIGYNQLYKYNAKTEAFIRKLKTVDRFQQHCILKDKAYTLQNFNEYKSEMDWNEEYERGSAEDWGRDYD